MSEDHSSARPRPGPRRRTRLRALLAALAVAVSGLVAGSPAQASAPGDPGVVSRAAVIDVPGARGGSAARKQQALLDYWTPERVRRATGEKDGPKAASTGERADPRVTAAVDGPYSTAVGKLVFEHANGKPDYCTATAVDSDSELLVLTAAHCLHEGPGGTWMKNVVFIPARQDGNEPFGRFTAWNIATSPLWSSGTKPDWEHDYGMVITNDNAKGQTVVEAAGGYQIAPDARTGEEVSVMGYSGPPYDGEHQEFCTDLIEPTAPPLNLWQVECANMTPGSSGSPWLLDYDYDTGSGYIGGLNSISDTQGFMASPRFDARTGGFVALMEQMAAARP
ncbi:trypsin-like serine peptidase [Streptomyces sp. NPDC058257]|uniref:trypsin-like serine peptidase n=1 Tax=Streptomyces sp. NPDC058257 TaxID=3346409 RepID=UPI0036EE9142